MNAEILTIGTELLLGEITDTNTGYIARKLASIGVNLYRTTSVGDNEERIAACIRESLERVDLLITTGGLGPTVDDPTREAVARAFNRPTVFHPGLWEGIQQLFQRWGSTAGENNRRQAFLPADATPIHNPVGTAPGFIIETPGGTVVSLPGVPLEMETLMEQAVLPYIRNRYKTSGTIRVRLLHTVGLGESTIDEQISDFETCTNPTVGLAAHSGQVDIRLSARADSNASAGKMLDELELQIRSRLGDRIYGKDNTTLEEAAVEKLQKLSHTLAVLESGLDGLLTARLNRFPETFSGGLVLPPMGLESFQASARQYSEYLPADFHLFAHLQRGKEHRLNVEMLYRGQLTPHMKTYGGPVQAAHLRAVNLTLDLLRRR